MSYTIAILLLHILHRFNVTDHIKACCSIIKQHNDGCCGVTGGCGGGGCVGDTVKAYQVWVSLISLCNPHCYPLGMERWHKMEW